MYFWSANPASLSLTWLCRGDVGSWVREAAMKALVVVVSIMASEKDRFELERLQGIFQQAICLLLQQSVERIARVRMVRGKLHL